MFVNPFPDLLTYALLAPFVLRVAVAMYFVHLATHHFRNKKTTVTELSLLKPGMAGFALGLYATVEALVAVGLFLGIYTQIAALAGLVICLTVLFLRHSLHQLTPLSRGTYALLGVICLALLFTGAGLFGIDLAL